MDPLARLDHPALPEQQDLQECRELQVHPVQQDQVRLVPQDLLDQAAPAVPPELPGRAAQRVRQALAEPPGSQDLAGQLAQRDLRAHKALQGQVGFRVQPDPAGQAERKVSPGQAAPAARPGQADHKDFLLLAHLGLQVPKEQRV